MAAEESRVGVAIERSGEDWIDAVDDKRKYRKRDAQLKER